MNFNSTSRPPAFQTHQLLAAILDALTAHTPEGIKAAGEEVRKQIALTEEQQVKYDEAIAAITAHEDVSRLLVAQRQGLEADQAKLVKSKHDNDIACASVDKILITINDKSAQLDAREKSVTQREQDTQIREKTLAARTQELDELQRALAAEKDILAKRAAKLKAAANDMVA